MDKTFWFYCFFSAAAGLLIGFMITSHPGTILFLGIASLLMGACQGWIMSRYKALVQTLKGNQQLLTCQAKQLQKQEDELSALFFNDSSWIWSLDLEKRVLKVSSGIERMLGYSRDEFAEDFDLWINATHPDDRALVDEHYGRLLAGERSEEKWRFRRKDGGINWIKVTGQPIKDQSGRVVRIVGVANDFSHTIEYEEQLRRVSFTDSLTGLPNRMHFNKRMAEILREHGEEDELAVIYFNIDRLKFINDMLGYEAGDQLLQETARRLYDTFRPGDYIVRYGGDEFIAVLPHTGKEKTKERANALIAQMDRPFKAADRDVSITVSAGVVFFPDHGASINNLMSNATAALKRAKARGKNLIQYYEIQDEAAVKRKLEIELALKGAIDRQEFMLYYQPKVNLLTGDLYGVEALLRWKNPTLGFVSPAEFIPVAEKSGQMLSIGKWVMKEGIAQAKRWLEKGMNLKVAVNVSGLQFEDPDFLDHIRRTLQEYALPPQQLGVELTESMVQNVHLATPILFELRQMGIHIYIDDFGTGYSSLNVLKTLPIDYIKIDKSFVDEIDESEQDPTMVKTIIDMGKNLGFGLVAEGIETEHQAQFLRDHDCNRGQGYFFARPMPPLELERFYEKKSKEGKAD